MTQQKQEIKLDQDLWKYEDEELNDCVLKMAQEELGETPEVKNTSIRLLREKIEAKKCRFPFTEDKELLKYLRAAKFDVSEAFKRMENMHHQRQKYSHLFTSYYPDTCKKILGMNFHHLLPYRNTDGSSIVVGITGIWNPEELSFEELVLTDHLIFQVLVNSPVNQICGCTIILDMEGFSYKHVLQYTPKRLSMAIAIMQNAIPVRYKAIHVVNAPQIFILSYNLLKSMFNQKIRNRVFVHPKDPSFRSLHDFISPSILPGKYGGDLCDMNNNLLRQCIDKEKAYFTKLLMSSDDCY